MYRLITEADEHEDVETVKLLGKKLTFVHRRLWLELYTVLTSKADWQMQDSAMWRRRRCDELNPPG